MSEIDAVQEQRDALARELAELQWDLGGLTYEMAIRDHFRLDVLVRQAGRLQEVDARLGEVEHQLRLDRSGAAGACPQCGTLYARGALFCSHCGLQLVQVQPAGELASPAVTQRLPAPAPAAPDAPYGVHTPDVPAADAGAPDERARNGDVRAANGAERAASQAGRAANGDARAGADEHAATVAFEHPSGAAR